MNQDDKYWLGDNGNRWSKSTFSKAEAIAADKSCTDCTDCTDCILCTDCTECTRCTDCFRCTGCTDCFRCTGCFRCTECARCTECTECTECTGCTGCTECTGFLMNPSRYGRTGLGADWSNTCVYWSGDKVQVVCGCFTGDISEFKAAVTKKYGDKHSYHDYVNTALELIEMEKEG